MVDRLSELKNACNAIGSKSDLELIEDGESVWFGGHPNPAAPGTVSLLQRNNIAVVIDEKDVLEVDRKDQIFMVRVKAGTKILARMENVVSVRPNCCSHSTKEAGESISRREGNGDGEEPTITVTCVIRFLCFFSYLENRWRCEVYTECDK